MKASGVVLAAAPQAAVSATAVSAASAVRAAALVVLRVVLSITGIISEIINDAFVVLRNVLAILGQIVLGRIINAPSSLVD